MAHNKYAPFSILFFSFLFKKYRFFGFQKYGLISWKGSTLLKTRQIILEKFNSKVNAMLMEGELLSILIW